MTLPTVNEAPFSEDDIEGAYNNNNNNNANENKNDPRHRGGRGSPDLSSSVRLSHNHYHRHRHPWALQLFAGCSSHKAQLTTILGCLSSCTVLTIRLLLDFEPMAYIIHSIIVFLDMVLIHLFTHNTYLSIGGEVVTIIHFLCFHYTKATVFELMETTILAVLCSFHLIYTRKEVMVNRDDLEEDIQSLRRRGALLLRNISQVHRELEKEGGLEQSLSTIRKFREQDLLNDNDDYDDDVEEEENTTTMDGESTNTSFSATAEDTELTRELLRPGECSCPVRVFSKRLHKWLVPFDLHHHPSSSQHTDYSARVHAMKATFFEYFLDGAAGVMYTSFLGLIIDELISYGRGDEKYR